MPNRLTLTTEQRRAAATRAERAFIVAAPGSGKTTVAAERFGVVRYGTTADQRRVLGLSFTRSATWEFAGRIRRRWGSSALAWPHEVTTLDGLHCDLVAHLLRMGVLLWPGGHTELTVLDKWQGQAGARYLHPQQRYGWVATVQGTQVTSKRSSIGAAHGFGSKDAFESHLRAGVCTHEEIRAILSAALGRNDLKPVVAEYLKNTVRAVVVDEVFDANHLDMDIVVLACETGIPTTLIGDPWQALYEFRGAQPELIPRLVERWSFDPFPVSESFRFTTNEMKHLAANLRASRPVALSAGSAGEVDVVLAAQWDTLWEATDCVLPLSFGKIDNQTDAAIIILLDQLVKAHFGRGAIFTSEAIALLGLDPNVIRADGPTALTPVLETLSVGTPEATSSALRKLRGALRELGSPRQLKTMPATSEMAQMERLQALAKRMRQPRLVAGMTVHQAKGQEWPVVGVRLTPAQVKRLAKGLSQDDTEDRLLYVALTRGCCATRRV